MSDRLWSQLHRRVTLPLRPLQRRWHRHQVVRECPAMAEVFAALDRHCGPLEPTERSVLERRRRGLSADRSLVYGELSWPSFRRLIAAASPAPGERFVELGCGIGQFCFYMQRRHGMQATGVDRMADLIAIAGRVREDLEAEGVAFQTGDLFELDLEQASLLYVTSTCFDDPTLARLTSHLQGAPSGARIISLGRPLSGAALRPVAKQRCWTSWGRETAWVYLRG